MRQSVFYFCIILVFTVFISSNWNRPTTSSLFTGHGNPAVLQKKYTDWKIHYESQQGARFTRLPFLSHKPSLPMSLVPNKGEVVLDLVNGTLKATVRSLDSRLHYTLWFLGRSAVSSDRRTSRLFKIGDLTKGHDEWSLLHTALLPSFEFTLEAILVVESGKNPRTSALLYATPNLFQRIYYNEYSRMSTLASNTDVDKKNVVISPGSWLLKTAYAERGYTPRTPVKVDLSHLIAKGRDIFVNETFEGNGRTCATCHRPDNNHTIDPKYIAQLPITDPLFVAETNPLLSDLEKPTLLRQFGLFVSHVDGFNRPGVMRSVPSLLALSTSLTVETRPMGGEFFEDTDFLDKNNQEAHAVGWSQDGAVGHGSLREFAKGAVQEHFPKSLGRAEGIDFRMPTEDELDALEAYMLSLGRTDDPSLSELKFRSPWIEKGKELFNQKQNPVDKNGNPLFGRSANCSGCHMNAGASSSTTLANPTRDTGVERMRDTLARLSDADIPYDGGFGQVLQEDCGPDYNAHCYSDGSNDPRGIRPFSHQRLNRFNTPSLIEAADTAPFFHNHSIATLEEAVGYYNTNAFNESPGAFTSSGKNRQTHIDSSQVEAVALFLRYINVLENIRSANQLAENAFTADSLQAKELVRLAIADTEDAIQVIEEGGFIPHPEVLAVLKKALESDTLALSSRFSWQRTSDLKKSIQLCNQAKSEIIDQ